MSHTPRRNAKQEKHDREFQEFLTIRNQAWEPVWDQGRILYEEAQGVRLQGDHLGVVSRFRQILAIQATARETFAELIKGNPLKDPSGMCCRDFEGQFEAFIAAIEYQLAQPLTLEECRVHMDEWTPRSSQNPEWERDIQRRKVLTYHMAGGCTGYSDTVKLVYTTPYDNYLDSNDYRWGKTRDTNRDLYVLLAPPDARGTGYWLTPWGDQIGALLLREHPELLIVPSAKPVTVKAARKVPRPRRAAALPQLSPVWIRNTRGQILAGGMPLFPEFMEAR